MLQHPDSQEHGWPVSCAGMRSNKRGMGLLSLGKRECLDLKQRKNGLVRSRVSAVGFEEGLIRLHCPGAIQLVTPAQILVRPGSVEQCLFELRPGRSAVNDSRELISCRRIIFQILKVGLPETERDITAPVTRRHVSEEESKLFKRRILVLCFKDLKLSDPHLCFLYRFGRRIALNQGLPEFNRTVEVIELLIALGGEKVSLHSLRCSRKTGDDRFTVERSAPGSRRFSRATMAERRRMAAFPAPPGYSSRNFVYIRIASL